MFLICVVLLFFFFFSSRRRHTRLQGDWSSDVCSSDLVEQPRLAVRRRNGRRLHRGGVGADAWLRQGERRDRALREARQIFLLLGVAAEQLQRLGHADRLMRRQERRDGAVDRRDQLDGLHIRQLREAQPTVLARDLDPERAQVAQALDDSVGDLALAVDAVRIDLLAEQALELVEERLRPPHLLGILLGVGMDEIEAKLPEEQVAYEARRDPLLLARGLGDLARFGGADLALRCGGGGDHGPNLPCGAPGQEARLEQQGGGRAARESPDRKSTRLNSSHLVISYA